MQRPDVRQVRLTEVEDDAAANEGGGQVALVVARDDDQRDAALAGDAAASVGNFEAQTAEHLEEIVRQVGIGFVYFVDQDHRRCERRRRLPVFTAERPRVFRRLLIERLPHDGRAYVREQVRIELLQVGVLQAAQMIDFP